ncbi:MAG: V-type ATPase 116kDa subunit family protein [Proteiniphilum sp.]|nr:V-type ATPase 116kDa subunit family protein [Proteiniphilum sp.]NCD14628.1 V-type ATP synthase subunit I [Bacteroidia bacterium]MDD3332288.1 V-type ATPase 116kDa subunit family protein [Proteiniphilum sp.]MDD3980003.1 V-type ATPase 116kDa subunit family protein [Proteiniphilum sp.]MDD4486448.1 V-type ATPase 116kDa subunit family protein [Proteiniphilum sp.]
MVARMKKFTFLIFHRDYDRFLHELRELGMIHVVEKEEAALNREELHQFIAESKLLKEARKTLEKVVDKKTFTPTDQPSVARGMEIPAAIAGIEAEKSALTQKLHVSIREREALRPWGNFNPTYLKKLEEAGYHLNLFITPDRNYNPEWEEEYNALIIRREGSKTYFLTLTREAGLADRLNLEEMKHPELSLQELDQLTVTLHEQIGQQEEALKKLTAELPSLDAALSELNTKILFTRVADSATPLAEEKLKLLQGWAPLDNEAEIAAYLASKEVYFETATPQPEDDVPIKFANNRFTRLFEPIAELYMLPKYNEIDLTPFFAPFFMIFFGLALGDIGYGVFLFAGATFASIFMKKKLGKAMIGILRLVQILGASATICGLLTGGFFGFNIYETNIPFFQNMKDQVYFDNQQMFNLSLVLGVIQIMFGLILKIFNRIKQFGFMHALSTIGWVILLMSVIVAFLFPALLAMGGTLHLILMGAAAILIFLFNSPGKNPLLNIGLGLYDTYNMATGLLGDVLSYVRLFALGLSGGILASVFNSLALGLKPDNLIGGSLVFLLIFLFGHAMNIFMTVLGAIVHPMRLTFVEFYKNAEFAGGGKRYNPFRK